VTANTLHHRTAPRRLIFASPIDRRKTHPFLRLCDSMDFSGSNAKWKEHSGRIAMDASRTHMSRNPLKTILLILSLTLSSGAMAGCTPTDTVEIEDINYDIDPNYLPRVNFGQKYEPKGNYILHGAGQAANGVTISFDNYVQALGDLSLMPAISMGYVAPHHNFVDWTAYMKQGLERYPDDYVMLQVGVHFNRDEDPDNVYYEQIADGEMDTLVKALILYLKSFNRPVYVRPGFEFNGEWNGYTDASIYKRAFIRFCELVDEAEAKNIAILWCYNPDASEKNYLKYYPGDQYVDWWAIDIFRIGSIESENTLSFLADAEAHHKPVMITEATPYTYDVGADEGWDEWFVPYFDFIRNHPVIKATCYINWKWTDYPQWINWGDARLEESTTVLAHYIEELSDPIYLHAGSKDVLTPLLYRYEDLDTEED